MGRYGEYSLESLTEGNAYQRGGANVKEMSLSEITNRVNSSPKQRQFAPRRGGRPRDPVEQRLLDDISRRRWQEAVTSGKVIMRSPREWYYEL